MMRFNFFKKQKEEPVKVLELFVRLMGFAVRRDDGTFDDEYFERTD